MIPAVSMAQRPQETQRAREQDHRILRDHGRYRHIRGGVSSPTVGVASFSGVQDVQHSGAFGGQDHLHRCAGEPETDALVSPSDGSPGDMADHLSPLICRQATFCWAQRFHHKPHWFQIFNLKKLKILCTKMMRKISCKLWAYSKNN